jgi:hypothetical protein
VRVGTCLPGHVRGRLLISMTAETRCRGRCELRRSFLVALPAFQSCGAVRLEEKHVIVDIQRKTDKLPQRRHGDAYLKD